MLAWCSVLAWCSLMAWCSLLAWLLVGLLPVSLLLWKAVAPGSEALSEFLGGKLPWSRMAELEETKPWVGPGETSGQTPLRGLMGRQETSARPRSAFPALCLDAHVSPAEVPRAVSHGFCPTFSLGS